MIVGLHCKIIHSTKHKDTLVRLLAEVLVRDHGLRVCCDEHELHAADPLTESLELGTRSSVLDMAVRREALFESGWTKPTDEVRLFSGNGIERVAKSFVAAMRRPPRVLGGGH